MEHFMGKKVDTKIPIILMTVYLKRLKLFYLQGGNLLLNSVSNSVSTSGSKLGKNMILAEHDF
jgi:hypothetical protein